MNRASFKTKFVLVLIGLSVPLTAWSLSLSDYLNQSTVVASSSQFETNVTNNTDTVQIIPNAEIIITKAVINDDGGLGVLADFGVTTSAGALTFDAGVAVADTTTFTSETIYVPPGVYTLTELDSDGYTEGTWSCTVGTMGSTTFDSASVTLAYGEQTVCSISNDDVAPTLTLTKNVVNDDGGLLAAADFNLSVDGATVTSGTATTVASNTSIIISENLVDGYTEGAWACTDANGLTTGLPTAGTATGQSISLAAGANVTCEISNDDIAPILTLAKTVINDNGGLKSTVDFDLSIDTTIVTAGTPTPVLANTEITVSELDLPGYIEGTWSCVDASGLTTVLPTAGVATNTLLNLNVGSDVTCSISNDDIAPTLTLAKVLLNDNGGDLTVPDFEISVDGGIVDNGVASTVLANTDITISELALPGYTQGVWECTDSNSLTLGLPAAGAATAETVSLAPGAEVTCRITNDDIAPTLVLAKTVVNDNGGDKLVGDFNLSIDGAIVPNGGVNTVLANADIEISELDLPGYTVGDWECVDANSLTTGLPTAGTATGEIFQLKQGSEVTCSITNNDIAPTLTLVKNVVNDNGGDGVIDDFDISIDASEVVSGAANPVLANTVINISELDLAAYAEGVWSCTDANSITTGLPAAGLATSTDLTLLPGSDVTCAIDNNDLGIDLTIAKTVDDGTPNIGDTITFSLEVTNAGPDLATDVTVLDPVPAGFTYVLGSISGGDVSDDSDPTGAGLTWTINSIPVGTPAVLTFQAVVLAP